MADSRTFCCPASRSKRRSAACKQLQSSATCRPVCILSRPCVKSAGQVSLPRQAQRKLTTTLYQVVFNHLQVTAPRDGHAAHQSSRNDRETSAAGESQVLRLRCYLRRCLSCSSAWPDQLHRVCCVLLPAHPALPANAAYPLMLVIYTRALVLG